MTDDGSRRRELVPLPDRTLGPARSLATRTLAALQASDASVPRRLVVAADGSAMFTAIGAAIEVARDGDEVLVRPGTYRENLVVDLSLTLRGDGPAESIEITPQADGPCLELRSGTGIVSGISFTCPSSKDEQDEELEEDPPLVHASGGDWTLERIRVRRSTSDEADTDAVGASGQCRVAVRDSSIECPGRGVGFSDAASGVVEGCSIEADGDGVSIEGSGMQIVRHCRIRPTSLPAVSMHDALAPVIEDCDLYGEVDVTESASPVVRSNRIRSPGEGISIWQSGGDYAANTIYAGRFSIKVTGGAATIRANQIGEGNSGGIWAVDGFTGEIVDNDVWGPYPEAIITVEGSPDCRVFDNRGQSPLRQDGLAVDATGPGVGVSMPNPRMKDNPLLAEFPYIWPNVFDPSKPLPQEILLVYQVASHGGVEVWLWAPMYHDDEFTYFDQLIARAVSQARDLQPHSIVNVRLSVGEDGLLRGQEVGIPGRPDRDLAIYPAPLSEPWFDVDDEQQEPAES